MSSDTVAVAITGASGAIYATRTLASLLERGVHVELVISDYGRRLLRDELGEQASIENLVPFLTARYGGAVSAGTINLHSNRDLGATIASGSHGSHPPRPPTASQPPTGATAIARPRNSCVHVV